MGDMEFAIPNGEDKVMTATSSNQQLQVSISFGKFENDSLSWEKFSSFSPNKYLEEVEKCATVGSVAQKKAYFESQYKKIADRKAEIILEQDRKLERDASLRTSVQNRRDVDSENGGSVMIESSACCGSNGKSTSEEDELVTSIATEVNDKCIQEPLEETIYFEECQRSIDTGEDLDILKLEKLEEIVCVEDKPDLIVQEERKEKPEEVACIEEEVKEEMKEDVSSKIIGEMKETPMKVTEREKDQNLIKKTDRTVQTNHTRSSPKPNQVTKKPAASKVVTSRKTQPSKDKNMTKARNKSASPVSKAPGFSTPRMSKPASTISSMSSSRSSAKKESFSTLPPRKKQTAPKPMHISVSRGQPSSDTSALATTGKSLIMERMGNKEIVRRAFKTFRKTYDQMKPSDDHGQDTAPEQVLQMSTSVLRLATNGQKENSRLAKSDGAEKKSSNSYRSSSFVKKSNGAAKKQELSRPGARAVERIRLQAKPKAEATKAKTRRQSLDPEVKSMQGGALPKGSSDKVL